MRIILGMLLVAMALSSTENALAFDGKRQGFLLGFGLGASSYTMDEYDSKTAMAADFKIGYGISDRIQVYYGSKISLRLVDGDSETLLLHGLNGIGANYYVNPDAPSLFLGGGVGLAAHELSSTGSNDDTQNYSGTGFFINGGYEFARHWNVELAVIQDTIDAGDRDLGTWTVMLTLNGLAY